MKKNRARTIGLAAVLAGFCAGGLCVGRLGGRAFEAHAATSHAATIDTGSSGTTAVASWDAKAAASYLDYRAEWWEGWDRAKRDQGTFCVSCHTVMPYTLARPALRKMLGEQTPSEDERLILENVVKRVRLWKELAPVYSDEKYGKNKAIESRGTESVLLAFVLANRDAQSGKLSEDGKAAFEHLWEQQQTDGERKGAWLWQMFGLNPWEGDISPYYGAALAAVAVGTAPEAYRAKPEIQHNIEMLREYLDREYAAQPLVNKEMLLWAAAKVPGLATAERQKAIIGEILKKQRDDGGWNFFQLAMPLKDENGLPRLGGFKRLDGSLQDTNSDGFATGFTVYVLEQSGVPRESDAVKRGLAWLEKNQSKTDGTWLTYSINKKRELTSDAGRFMSDAATAYAVLALAN